MACAYVSPFHCLPFLSPPQLVVKFKADELNFSVDELNHKNYRTCVRRTSGCHVGRRTDGRR